MQLDVSGRLEVAGDQPEQVSVVDEPRQQLGDPRQHPVLARLAHRLMQVVKAALEQPGKLLAVGPSVQDRLKGLTADVGIGHPRVGELSDVGGNSVELIEGHSPGGGTRPAGDEQGAVDVKEDGREGIRRHRDPDQ